MPSLSIIQRPVKGIGWTDSPVLIYPSSDQVGFVNRIIKARADRDDSRAGNTEYIREMLNDETVLSQNDRWRYVIPDELVKVENGIDTAFAIRELFCEALLYGDAETLASAIPSNTSIITDFSKESARKFLTLAHRINELRKINELHYRHVHKIHYVYEDHAGYTLDGSAVIGGGVNYREYVGAITSVNALYGTETISFGEHFIDYTMPPVFNEDRAFYPDMFTGVKINNPNRATKYQIPILNRVFPDLGVTWIATMQDSSQANIDNNWNAQIKDIEPTAVKAAHINELRKAFSAYSQHVHNVVLQTVDLKPLQTTELTELGNDGSTFGIDLNYSDLRPPNYLKSLGSCLASSTGVGHDIKTKLTPEVPLYHHVYYNGKTDQNGLLSSLKGLLLYSDFQPRYFSDEKYPSYFIPHAPVLEDAVMIKHLKEAKFLVYNSATTDNTISLNISVDPLYSGIILKKAPDDNGTVPDTMKPILISDLFTPTISTRSTTNISKMTAGAPTSYPIGTGINSEYTKANVYEVEGLLGNTGYIKVAFIPTNNLDKVLSRDSLDAYSASGRMYLVSYGQDNCVGTNWTPGIALDIPELTYEMDRADYIQFIPNSSHAMNLFVSVPTSSGEQFRRKVYNACGSMKFSSEYNFDSILDRYAEFGGTSGNNDRLTRSRPAFGLYGTERIAPLIGTGDNRGLTSSTDVGGNAFYFRQVNPPLSGSREKWNDTFVHQSMRNLIEIWIERSQFSLIDGYPKEDLYTIHASVSDFYGGIVAHLSGDVIINEVNAQDVWEVELAIDLRPGKTSQLAAGYSQVEESDIVTVDILNISSINNNVMVSELNGAAVDDLIVITGSASNNGTYRIREVVAADMIQITDASGSNLIDETPGSPLTVGVYKYKEVGRTIVLCETLSSDPTENDSLEGIQRYCYAEDLTIKDHIQTANISRFWHSPRSAIDGMLKRDRHFGDQNQLKKAFDLIAAGKDVAKEYAHIDTEMEKKLAYRSYKSPDSQILGFYRTTALAPGAPDNITIKDFNGLAKTIASNSSTGKTVVSLGFPIAGLNLDHGNKFAIREEGVAAGYYDRWNSVTTLRRPVNDAFDTWGTSNIMVPSTYNDYSGHFPILKHEADPLNLLTKVRFLVRSSEVKVGDKIRILFGDTQSYYKEILEATVDTVTPITTNYGSTYSPPLNYQAQYVYITKALTSVNSIVSRVAGVWVDFSEGQAGLLQIVDRPVKYIPPSFQRSVNKVQGGLSFIFKSILISTEPTILTDRTAFGYKYGNLSARKLRFTDTGGDAVTISDDGLSDHAFNQVRPSEVRTPLMTLLNHAEFGGGYDVASATIHKIIGVTEKPYGGNEVLTSFSNGSFQSDGYSIKQIKGTLRNPTTGSKIEGEEGDPIRASDVNELYNAAKWLKSHTHTFEFTHTTDQPIYLDT